MSFRGFEGPAGTGKTHRLIEEVGRHLVTAPLASHQRVLALTFMHGSRKRLDGRFGEIPTLRNKAVCMTIDSFAQSIFQRWVTFAAAKGISAEGFNQVCDACGKLLEYHDVVSWVSRSFPVVVVDEAQELKPERLRILKALAPYVSLFVAADEFQCLDDTVDTAPFLEWFVTGQVESLTIVHRTTQQGLLNAGVALRALQSPCPDTGLAIAYHFPNVMPFAIASTLHSCSQGSKALIYAPSGHRWADDIITRVTCGMQSRGYGRIPPLRLFHEEQSKEEQKKILALFAGASAHSADAICAALDDIASPPPWLASVRLAIVSRSQTQGLYVWALTDLTKLVERKAALYRAFGFHSIRGIPVMSIHQAKNRQFDHVVLLWPPGVPGSDEWKARLLYNGITRSARSCHVFVRSRQSCNRPPFLF